jgi:hypothetical protein
MWTHVSEAALMDVLDGTAGDGVLSHVQGCARCRTRVDEARGGLRWTEQVTVPEPVPAYWDVFRRHVARRIAETPAAPSRRPLWAAAAAAGAVLAAVLTVGPGSAPRGADPIAARALPALPAWSPLPAAEDDLALPLLEEAAPTMAASSAALECGDVSECVGALSDEESSELADALRQQLGGGRAL